MRVNEEKKSVQYWLDEIEKVYPTYLDQSVRNITNNLFTFAGLIPEYTIPGFTGAQIAEITEYYARMQTRQVISNAGFDLPHASTFKGNSFFVSVQDHATNTTTSHIRGVPKDNVELRKKCLITDTIMNAYTVTNGRAKPSSSVSLNTYSRSAGRNVTKLTHPFNKKFIPAIAPFVPDLDTDTPSIHAFEQHVQGKVELFKKPKIDSFFQSHPPIAVKSSRKKLQIVYRTNSAQTFESERPSSRTFAKYGKYMTGLQALNGGKQSGSSLITRRYLTGMRLGTTDNTFVNKCYMVSRFPILDYKHIHVIGDVNLAQLIHHLHPTLKVTCDRKGYEKVKFTTVFTEHTLVIDMLNTNVPQSYVEPVSFNGQQNDQQVDKHLQTVRQELFQVAPYDRLCMSPWYLVPNNDYYYSLKVLSGIVFTRIMKNERFSGKYNFNVADYCIQHMEAAFNFRCGSLYSYMQTHHYDGYSFRVEFFHKTKVREIVTAADEEDEPIEDLLPDEASVSEEKDEEIEDLEEPTKVLNDVTRPTPVLKPEQKTQPKNLSPVKKVYQPKTQSNVSRTIHKVAASIPKVFQRKETDLPTQSELLEKEPPQDDFPSESATLSGVEYFEGKASNGKVYRYHNEEDLALVRNVIKANTIKGTKTKNSDIYRKVDAFYKAVAYKYDKSFMGVIETHGICGIPVRLIVYFGAPYALQSLRGITWYYKKRTSSPKGFFDQ